MNGNRHLWTSWVGSAALVLATAGLLGSSVSPVSAATPGPSGKIAFERDGNIWAVERDGSGLTQLTSGPDQDGDPAWAPTGRHLAFARNGVIHVMNADGTNIVAISKLDVAPSCRNKAQSHPDWRWDGQEIILSVTGCSQGGEENIGKLAAFPFFAGDATPGLLNGPSAYGCEPPDIMTEIETTPAASPLSIAFSFSSRLRGCGPPPGGGAFYLRSSQKLQSFAGSSLSELRTGAWSIHARPRTGGIVIPIALAFPDSTTSSTHYEYAMPAYFPDGSFATISYTSQLFIEGGQYEQKVVSSSLFRGGGPSAERLATTGDSLPGHGCIRNVVTPDVPLDGRVVAAGVTTDSTCSVYEPEYYLSCEEHPAPIGLVCDNPTEGWGDLQFPGVAPGSVLLMDADGTNKRVVPGTLGGSEPDVQCAPGSCLTGIRVIKLLEGAHNPATYTFSGSVSGTIAEGGVLFQKLPAGQHTVTEELTPGSPLQSIECAGLPLSQASISTNVPQRSVTIGLTEGDVVTCEFTNLGSEDDMGRIVVEKQTIPNASDAEFDFSGAVSGTISDGETLSRAVTPGTYSVTESESDEDDWVIESIACEDGDSSGTGSTATINVGVGETVWCTFTNKECNGLEFSETLDVAPRIREFSTFPNWDTACEGVFVPDVEFVPDVAAGFIPQGLALEGRTLEGRTALVSGYFNDPKRVRIMRVSLDTGKRLVWRDLPGEHGGGIALGENGEVWLADTTALYRFELATLFDPGVAPKKVRLQNPLRGSFLANGPSGHLWIGTYESNGPSMMYEFPIDKLVSVPASGKLTTGDRSDIRDVANKANGADLRSNGFWVASSNSKCGVLTRNHADGKFGFGPGVEEVEFDSTGDLWAVFEAGAGKYQNKFYPVIARFDIDKVLSAPKEVSAPDCTP